jgi:hypothetical protein
VNCSSDDDKKTKVVEEKIAVEFKSEQLQLLLSEQTSLLDQLILSNVDLSDLSWQSNNTEVVEINKDVVKAKAKGEAIVSVTIKNTGQKASIKIIISDFRIAFKQEEVEVSSKGKDFDLTTLLILENTTKEKIVWESSNEKVVKVEKGILKALTQGEAIITAKIKNTAQQVSIKVIVDPMNMYFKEEKILIDATKIKSIDLNPYLVIENIDKQKITWGSSNSSIMSVDHGVVSIHNDGDVQIYANLKWEQIRVGIRLISTGLGITYMHIVSNGSGDELLVNSEYKYWLEVYPEPKDVSQVKWTSSNNAVANVDNTGMVKANAVGQTTITAIAPSGFKTALDISVIPRQIRKIYAGLSSSIDGTKIFPNQTVELNIGLDPSGLEDMSLLGFKSSNTSLVTVNSKGVVKSAPDKTGKVKVTVYSIKNPSINAVVDIDIISAFYQFYTMLNLVGEVRAGIVSGEVKFQAFDDTECIISEFKVFNSNGKLLYQDNSVNRFYSNHNYQFSLDKADNPYVTYKIQKQQYVEYRKQILVFK